MYWADLTPYRHEEYAAIGTKAIGWLSAKYEFSQGEVSPEFRDLLRFFCSHSIMQMRGFHVCEFCSDPRSEASQEDGLWLGNAETRVFYQEQVYAAPNLIYHYVLKHNYKPPDEFINAVLNGPKPGSKEYENLLKQIPYLDL